MICLLFNGEVSLIASTVYVETAPQSFAPGTATPAAAEVLQGPDAVQGVQSPDVFPGNGVEGVPDAAPRPAQTAGFPETHLRTGGVDVDRPCLVSCAVHGSERVDRPQFRKLALSPETHQALRPAPGASAADRPRAAHARALRSFSQTDAAQIAASENRRDAVGHGRPRAQSRLRAHRGTGLVGKFFARRLEGDAHA